VTFASDLRYSLRSYLRTPGLTATLVLTIALGVGGNAAVFGFIGGLITMEVESADPAAAARFARVAALLVGASALVLFMASSTIAGLLLARARTRAHEAAVRIALGASRRQFARLCLADGLLIAGLGGALGVVVAWWTTDLFPLLFFAEDAEQLAMVPDVGYLAAAGCVWFVVLLASALVPAVTISPRAPWSVLRRESAGTSDQSVRARRRLVMAQVGVACVLLVVASLIREDLRTTLRTTRGQMVGSLLIGRVDAGRGLQYLQDVESAVRTLPGVLGTAWVSTLPGGRADSIELRVERPQPRTREIRFDVSTLAATEMAADRLVPVAGRLFTVGDAWSACRVVVINETAADVHFGGDAVGRAIERSDGELFEIIGVLPSAPGETRPALFYDANQEPDVTLRPEDFYTTPDLVRPPARLAINFVSGSYFGLFADHPIEGRAFGSANSTGCRQVALISEDGAEALFGDEPIGGAVIGPDGGRVEIIGVVRAGPLGAAERRRDPVLTRPLGQAFDRTTNLAIRVREATDETRESLTTAIRGVRGGALLERVLTLEEHLVRTSLAPERVARTLVGVSAAIALVLAILGVHGGMAELVARRRQELALRAALGARASSLVGYVVRAGLALTAVGAATGFAVAFAASPLFGLAVRYPSLPSIETMVVAILAVVLLVVMACAVPAWRAVSIDPRDAMNVE